MTSVSQTGMHILEILWEMENPASLKEISEKAGLKIRSANMHLLRLRAAGYVSKGEHAYYTITESGKVIIGLPKVEEESARRILGRTEPDKVFHFYTGVEQPLGVSSNSLVDFSEKIKSIDMRSVEFHLGRRDFELWVHFLGDVELAKRLGRIREEGSTGDALRQRLLKTLMSRCDELFAKVS